MNAKTLFAGTSIALALAVAAATPAHAVVTEFATFSPVTATTYNFYYLNPGSTHPTTAGKSASATYYTISSPNSKVPGSTILRFSFINEGTLLDSAVTNVNAKFTLTGTTDGPAQMDPFSGNLEEYVNATFSFVTTTAMTIGRTYFPVGSNLLSGTYTDAVFVGSSTAGSIEANDTTTTPKMRNMTLTSDFVSFVTPYKLDGAITLNAASPAFSDLMAGMYALKTFKADAGGSFSSNPAPHVIPSVPEPASWALMMVGFGLAGASIRRRTRVQAAV